VPFPLLHVKAERTANHWVEKVAAEPHLSLKTLTEKAPKDAYCSAALWLLKFFEKQREKKGISPIIAIV